MTRDLPPSACPSIPCLPGLSRRAIRRAIDHGEWWRIPPAYREGLRAEAEALRVAKAEAGAVLAMAELRAADPSVPAEVAGG